MAAPTPGHQQVANQDKIWAYYQTTAPGIFSAASPRLNYILHRARRRATAARPSLLNIGAGDGYLERRAQALGWQVYSLDPDETAVERLAATGIDARVGYIEKMPFADGQFEVVITSEVLEHLSAQHARDGVADIARVLKPGGWFLGTVPYREDLSPNMVVCPDCGKLFHRWGHQQSFDADALRALFPPGLELQLARPKLFVPFQVLNWKGKLGACAKSVLFLLGIHGSNENWYFEARKR